MASNILKQTLDKLGFSQVELSTASKVAAGTINKICNKKLTPAPRTKSRITNGLNKLASANYQVHDIFHDDQDNS